jgi:N-acyl-D-aspartate/D-glutamate deacylase
VIDARNRIVSPGFVDAHNHADAGLQSEAEHLNEQFLSQGVTTVVLGPDGEHSPARIEALLTSFARRGTGTNVAFYVGHNGIRSEVMGGRQNREPSRSELDRMTTLVRQGMLLGAVGLSSGLMYSPGLFSETDEIVALASAVAPFDGIFEVHVRDPHRALLQSQWEAIEVARRAKVPLDLTHLTTPGKHHRGLMNAAIEQIEDARREGIQVVADQYPYPAVMTIQLWGVLNYPREMGTPTRAAIRAALRDPQLRARIREETLSGGATGFSQLKASGASSLLIMAAPDLPQYEGWFVSDVAAELALDGFDAVADLLDRSKADIVVSLGGFAEEDMRKLMERPWVMIASDGAARIGSRSSPFASPHPRSTGTFPRILGRYFREEGVLALTEAVRRMTSAPSEFLGLADRGRLIEGAAADIVIFDPRTVSDRSSWKEPELLAVGIETVLVNGKVALRNGQVTGAAPGMLLRRGQRAIAYGER